MLLIEINNVVDDGLLFITPWTFNAIQTLRLSSRKCKCLICQCICCKLDCIISTKWSLSIIIQTCANNRHFLGLCSNLLSTNARSLVIVVSGQSDMVDFA